jgi:hypothetical protein
VQQKFWFKTCSKMHPKSVQTRRKCQKMRVYFLFFYFVLLNFSDLSFNIRHIYRSSWFYIILIYIILHNHNFSVVLYLQQIYIYCRLVCKQNTKSKQKLPKIIGPKPYTKHLSIIYTHFSHVVLSLYFLHSDISHSWLRYMHAKMHRACYDTC